MTMLLRRLRDGDRDDWNALAASHPASGFGQSWAWSVFKEREGVAVARLGVFDEGRLIGGALVQHHGSTIGQSVVFVPDGPVIPWSDKHRSRECLRLIIDAAARIARREHAVALRIEPRIEGSRPAVLREFVRAPLDVYPQHTLLVDVTHDDAALLGSMRPKGRYNIRVAERHGVRVLAVDPLAGLRRFYELFEASALRDGFFAEPYGYFINLAETLSAANMLRLYLGTHDGDDLAAALMVSFGRSWTYLYGGSAAHKRNLMASYAIHWQAMRDARDRGATTYDFYGYEPYGLVDHPYAGFSRFKRQFGGRAVRYVGAQDYVFYDRLADAVMAGLAALDARHGAAARS